VGRFYSRVRRIASGGPLHGGIQWTSPGDSGAAQQNKHFNTDFTEKKIKPQI
jgi:hypothetical protein